MLNQQTLNRPASFSGIGLHSGNRVNMTILPAPANSGVRFRRVDLDGKPEIEARVENVSETNRSTTLAKGNVKVHTVEHVLAALAGYGIDNAVVELDANEPPIGDGSSREFCRIIQAAGLAAAGGETGIFHADRTDRIAAGRNHHDAVSGREIQDHLHQRGQARPVYPVLFHRNHARNPGKRSWRTRGRFVFLRRLNFCSRTA